MRLLSGRRLPRGFGIAAQLIGFPAAHGLLPWALSLLGARQGWAADVPSAWNFVGLIGVAAGFYTFLCCLREHFIAAPNGWRFEKTPHYPTPAYLLTEGPYRHSRHPIYLAELVIWLGWMVFYGSLILCGVFAAAALLLGPLIVPREERGLEARFGDAYRKYQRTTPRWLGKARRQT